MSFHLRLFDLFTQQETKKKGQNYCNEKEKTPLELTAGKTLMSFLRAGLSKCCGLGDTFHLPFSSNIKYKYFHKKENYYVFGFIATFTT